MRPRRRPLPISIDKLPIRSRAALLGSGHYSGAVLVVVLLVSSSVARAGSSPSSRNCLLPASRHWANHQRRHPPLIPVTPNGACTSVLRQKRAVEFHPPNPRPAVECQSEPQDRQPSARDIDTRPHAHTHTQRLHFLFCQQATTGCPLHPRSAITTRPPASLPLLRLSRCTTLNPADSHALTRLGRVVRRRIPHLELHPSRVPAEARA